ncbi:hypothetical protein DFQ30_004943 [Apophysomyces sp. BC1015]|nr:hypothetical protein DFQ30_004943 [Apophysomyces sp. BC1015]
MKGLHLPVYPVARYLVLFPPLPAAAPLLPLSTLIQIHPLEGIHRASRTSTLLDTPLLSIDLSLSPHTSTLEGRRIIQPWESQETLVQPKKQAYAASDTEEATTTTIDMKMSEDGYYDSTLGDSVSDCSTRQGDEENSPNANKRPRSWTGAGDGNDVEARGCWIGCCFVSCGQRPSRRALEKRRENQMKKKSCQRGWVFCTFISLILVVVTSYMLWPRTPLMRIEGAELTTPAKVTETRQGVMVGNVQFESAWLVNVTVDNRQNHVPTHLVGVQVLAKDALTGLLIGKGDKTDATVLPPNAISTIQLPVFVDYQAREASDTTFVNLRKTCTPQRQQTVSHNGTTIVQQPPRESLQLHFWITLHIFGLDWFGYKPTVIATPATGGFACPVA